ncbi:peptide chain release factor N(5)-glutamine methyltransferase [Lutibacter sp.]|uniref:peptide chain release factor N(5)-glutamine methyltransferase n=1 Tax=Lutibacter sp. TaxID=1925666 RepID=UPI0025BBDB76|nr:peptide chain release factor N(5)-glutamine methyltransferase [Lutibacter sp.]MCF6180993.1 peptide chain release factor N(5)-glutamine methyltransferase [Lutibacter sp.]
MNIINLKKLFFTELKAIYPDTEIQSFFNLLMNFKLNLLRTDIALNPSLKISEEAINYFHSAIGKLKKETPIQYIIGTTEFYGLTFKVNPSVLIPRPETEELIEWIISSTPTNKQLTILDVGTGSGCIAISLAKNLPKAKVYAIDVSSEALKTAKQNAEINNISIKFSEIDILNTTKLPTKFDVIVSNPPYVRELEKKQMQRNVLANEPHIALFVKDKNPLLFYDKIADLAKNHLLKNGTLYFEINQYLGKETVSLLKSKGFQNIKLKKDIFGVNRMLKATVI